MDPATNEKLCLAYGDDVVMWLELLLSSTVDADDLAEMLARRIAAALARGRRVPTIASVIQEVGGNSGDPIWRDTVRAGLTAVETERLIALNAAVLARLTELRAGGAGEPPQGNPVIRREWDRAIAAAFGAEEIDLAAGN